MMEREVRSQKAEVRSRKSESRFSQFLTPYFLLLTFCFLLLCFSAGFAQEGEFEYDSYGRRDPMIPLVTPQGLIRDIKSLSGRADLYLEGIIYDEGGESLAIIDGQIVKEGDILGKVKVLNIQKDKVIVLKDGQKKEIKLEKEEE